MDRLTQEQQEALAEIYRDGTFFFDLTDEDISAIARDHQLDAYEIDQWPRPPKPNFHDD